MTIAGTVRVRCPACQTEQEAELVQSINARTSLPLKVRLLEGKLNLLTCACGKRTQLAATLLYHDPDADYFCQACPGGEPAMVKGAEAFRAIGAAGTQRLVPSQNALMEKIKLLDAGLDDAVVEVLKVLLLASIGAGINRIVLFERVVRDSGRIEWVLYDDAERMHELLSSPLAAYDKLAASLTVKAGGELRIDRAWAVEAAKQMMANAN